MSDSPSAWPTDADKPAPATGVRYVVVLLATAMAILLYLDRFCLSLAVTYIKQDLSLSKQKADLLLGAFFLTYALGQVYCAIMPERLAQTDAAEQVKEAMGSGPFKFVAAERVPGQRVVFEKNKDYVPRDGKASFNAGPKIVYFDRVIWNFVPDPGTASAALQQGEVDWWENPPIDLVPQLKSDKNLVVAVKDRTGEIGCLRFNHLHPPFDKPAVRRAVLTAIDQKDVITAFAGAEPSIKRRDRGCWGSPAG